ASHHQIGGASFPPDPGDPPEAPSKVPSTATSKNHGGDAPISPMLARLLLPMALMLNINITGLGASPMTGIYGRSMNLPNRLRRGQRRRPPGSAKSVAAASP